MKLEIYRRELKEYNMVGACGYVVNAKRPTTAVRRFTKAVKESNKLNEAEKARIIEFVEDEKVFVEMLDGETHVGETNEYILDLEEIEDGYWYVSVSASVEKSQEGKTVETPSNEEKKEVEQKGNYTDLEMLVIKNFENGFNYGELEDELSDNACSLSFNELKPKGYSNKQIRGVVSSLIKKGLLFFDDWTGIDSCYPFRVTELGLIEYYKLFRHEEYEKMSFCQKCPSVKNVIVKESRI